MLMKDRIDEMPAEAVAAADESLPGWREMPEEEFMDAVRGHMNLVMASFKDVFVELAFAKEERHQGTPIVRGDYAQIGTCIVVTYGVEHRPVDSDWWTEHRAAIYVGTRPVVSVVLPEDF